MKISKEEFVRRAKNIHGDSYDYSQSNYINSTIKIKIVCKKHGEFTTSPNHHINEQVGCPICSRKKRNQIVAEKFFKKVEEIHGNLYSYEKNDVITYSTKLIVTCNIHGDFKTTINNHIHNKSGCLKCYNETERKSKAFTTEQFIQKAKEIHGDIFSYEKVSYKNSGTKITITCKIHGDFDVVPDNYINKKSGCPKCSRAKRNSNTKEFIAKAKTIHSNNEYDYSLVKYTKNKDKVLIWCNACRNSFKQEARLHLSGYGCQRCGEKYIVSKPETKWLDTYSILDENRQYKIADKINKKKFIVDGFDPISNTIYEFFGDYWHGNPKKFDACKINSRTGTTFGFLYEKTIKRLETLKLLGYNVIFIWEADYKEQQKKL